MVRAPQRASGRLSDRPKGEEKRIMFITFFFEGFLGVSSFFFWFSHFLFSHKRKVGVFEGLLLWKLMCFSDVEIEKT